MPPSHSLRQVEAEIRSSIERSFEALREELGKRLSLPPTLLSAETVAAFEAEGQSSRQSVQADLVAAIRRVDAARTQADVLAALLQAARGQGARAALLLCERTGAKLWSAEGFDGSGAAAGSRIAWSANARWAQFAEGRGTVPLGAADCAPLVELLGAPLPADGVLIPVVLRDRLAAALYADRRSGEAPVATAALQLLTYVAALALETLNFRERSATPTLTVGTVGAPGLPIWETPAAAAPPSAPPAPARSMELQRPVAPPAAAATVQVAVPSAPSPPTPPSSRARAADVEELLFGEAPSPGPVEAAAPAAAELPELDSLPELELEPLPEFEADDLEAPPPPVAAPNLGAETLRVPLPPPTAGPAAGATAAIDLSEEDTLLLQRSRADARARTPASPLTTTNVHVTSPLVPPPPRPFESDETFPGMARPTVPVPAPAPPAPPAAATPDVPSAANSRATAEVHPPSDVRGPGRAFNTRPQPIGALGAEASHEEARRLAKLLVSEIKLYNEDQIEAGRRSSDIYSRLREDIERSRQMYEERVDPRVRAQNDYFQQELVRILAAGDARALGV